MKEWMQGQEKAVNDMLDAVNRVNESLSGGGNPFSLLTGYKKRENAAPTAYGMTIVEIATGRVDFHCF